MLRSPASLFALLFLFACGGPKTALDDPKLLEQQEKNGGFATGRVTTNYVSEGCQLLVQLDQGKVFLIPVGLEEKYRKNGLHLRFKYRPSKISQGECLKGQPAEFEEVSIVLDPVKGRRSDLQDQ